MTLDRFNEFVLIPHIACRLIAEDRKCNIEEAFRVMVASGDAGDLLQPIVDSGKDERFDNLLMNIMRKDTKVVQVRKSKARPRTDGCNAQAHRRQSTRLAHQASQR
ncbi:hypothetical protein P692DRAFT_20716949 [Suillus brevipes Sb2]|nr:hypothetical protein P692DRAFT_20716949 [Suillus brevipes Sb2]